MLRLFVIVICLGLALMLSGGYQRLDKDATRAVARHEHVYATPRLGEARAGIIARLRRAAAGTLAGTQLGLLLAGALVWFLDAESTAGPLVMVALAWAGGQVGRVWGALREASGSSTVVGRRLRDVVPGWLLVVGAVAVAMVLGFAALCLGSGLPGVVTIGAVMLVVLAMAALVSTAAVRRALGADRFATVALPAVWHEALRGDAVRAAVVLVPGLAGVGLALAGTLAAETWLPRGDGATLALLGAIMGGLLVWLAALGSGMAAVRWHAGRVAAQRG